MRQLSGAVLCSVLVIAATLAVGSAASQLQKHVVVVTTDREAEPLLAQVAALLSAEHRVTAVVYGGAGPDPAGPVRTVRVPPAEADPARDLSWLERWERYAMQAPDAVVASRVAGCVALRDSGALAGLQPDLVVTTPYLDDACVLALLPAAPVVGVLTSPAGLPWVTLQLGGHYPIARLPVHGYPLGEAGFYERLGNAWRWWTLTRMVQRHYQLPVSAAVGHLDLEAAYDRVAAVYVSGDPRLQHDVPSDHRLRFLGCTECTTFNDLPKKEQSAISGAGLLVIRLHHPYTSLPSSFSAALTQAVVASALTPIDLSNVTTPGAKVIRSQAPAPDALAHPRARLFISDCSPSSVMLAIHFSVPLICVPFTAGQKMSTLKAVSLGVAAHVDRRSMTSESLRTAIGTVTSSAGTRRAVRAWADALRHDAVSPAAQLTHQVRHLLLFDRGWRRRRVPGMVQYYCLDIIGTSLVSSGVFLCCVALLFFWRYRVLSTRTKAKKE